MANRYRDRTSSDWLHVYNRGADRQDIFSLPGDQDRFERRLGAMALECGVEIHAYVLMTNHFHLLVHGPGELVSIMMHRSCSEYAAHYNDRTGRTGPLFTGRFGSVPIMDQAQQLHSARYIHRNPLDVVGPAALPAYRFSSLGTYLGRRSCPPWLITNELRAIDDAHLFLADVSQPHTSDRQPLASIGPARPISLTELLGVVDACGATRTVAMTIAVALRVATVAEIAEWFGVEANTVRQSARRGRIRLEVDDGFRRIHGEVLDHLDAA